MKKAMSIAFGALIGVGLLEKGEEGVRSDSHQEGEKHKVKKKSRQLCWKVKNSDCEMEVKIEQFKNHS